MLVLKKRTTGDTLHTVCLLV